MGAYKCLSPLGNGEFCDKEFTSNGRLLNHINRMHKAKESLDMVEKAQERTSNDASARAVLKALVEVDASYVVAQTGAEAIREIAQELRKLAASRMPTHEVRTKIGDIAKKLELGSYALDQLYKELRDTDLRKLQSKARKWDKVAVAVMEQMAEEVGKL